MNGQNRQRFLACFAACGSVLKASRWARIARSMHYKWLEDPEYQAAFADASKRAVRVLHDEAVRRAHDGVRKPIRYKGKIIGYDTEYSDALLLALLKAGDPEHFRDRSSVEVSGGRDSAPLAVTVVYDEK